VRGVTLGELSGADMTNVSGVTLDGKHDKVPTPAVVCGGIHYAGIDRTQGFRV